MKTLLKYRIESWFMDHCANTRWPRLYKFWDWVIVGDMGFRRWFSWAFLRREDDE
jgi:hypothetical protein